MPLISTSRFDKTLSDPTPLFAAVGAGDLALAKLRAARDSFDAQAWQEQARAKLSAQMDNLRAELNGEQGQVSDLPVRLQAAVADAVAMSATTYTELATRGRDVVARVRHQPSTDEMQADLPSTADVVDPVEPIFPSTADVVDPVEPIFPSTADALQPDLPSTGDAADALQPEPPSTAGAADLPPEGTTGAVEELRG